MGKRVAIFISLVLTMLVPTGSGQAHFGMVIPSTNVVGPGERHITATLAFAHPFTGQGMDLARPKAFYLMAGGQKTDLLPSLQPQTVLARKGWRSQVPLGRPAVYQLVMEPQPYFEPAEDSFIIHYTKSLVAAYGWDEGWQQPLGLPCEIVPLTRPFANYSGNSFTALVLWQGKPLAHAPVEVEFYNQGQKREAPSPYHITQVVHTDAQGKFTFTCPAPGWWGFAALGQADYTLPGPDGRKREVEVGGVIWLYLDPWPATR
ncbi:MAG: DUF4198 domain-containing protein [Thermodesulfobacteriota bacterium]